MSNKHFLNVVTTQCRPEDEARFDKWYNEVHVPMLKKFKGVKRVARYKLLNTKTPQFMAVYHFNCVADFEAFTQSPEFKAAMEEMNQSWPGGIDIVARQQSELIQEW